MEAYLTDDRIYQEDRQLYTVTATHPEHHSIPDDLDFHRDLLSVQMHLRDLHHSKVKLKALKMSDYRMRL